jgi:polyvinyl alcohol dehydrogenase (cytochrome)
MQMQSIPPRPQLQQRQPYHQVPAVQDSGNALEGEFVMNSAGQPYKFWFPWVHWLLLGLILIIAAVGMGFAIAAWVETQETETCMYPSSASIANNKPTPILLPSKAESTVSSSGAGNGKCNNNNGNVCNNNNNRTCNPTADMTNAVTWSSWGRDSTGAHNQPQSTVNVNNVGTLQFEWEFDFGPGSVSAGFGVVKGSRGGPACDQNFCYVASATGYLYKLNITTGQQVWNVSLRDPAIGGHPNSYSRNKPVLYQGKVLLGDLAIGSSRAWAFDQNTGAMLWTTVVDSHPAAGLSQSGVAACGMWIFGVSSAEESLAENPSYPCCSFVGSVLALDVNTGNIVWKTYMMPRGVGVSGAAVWGSTPSIDYSRSRVYIGTGNLYNITDPAALACYNNLTATGNFSSIKQCFNATIWSQMWFDSVVALDLYNGTKIWADQFMDSDFYNNACIFKLFGGSDANCPQSVPGPDADFGLSPIFTQDPQTGIDILLVASKNADIYGLLADNGSIVWYNKAGGSIGGGTLGGPEWIASIDSARYYMFDTNTYGQSYNDTVRGNVQCGTKLMAFDRHTGVQTWQTSLNSTIPPELCAVRDEYYALYGVPGIFYFISQYFYTPLGGGGTLQTPLNNGGPTASALNSANNTVVFYADANAGLYAVRGTDGSPLWSAPGNSDEITASNVIVVGPRVMYCTGAVNPGNFPLNPNHSAKLRSFRLP